MSYYLSCIRPGVVVSRIDIGPLRSGMGVPPCLYTQVALSMGVPPMFFVPSKNNFVYKGMA